MLELKNILKIYNAGTANEHILLKNFYLTINSGEFVSIIGPNGSGKTSLLNIICGAIPIEGGDILLDNVSIKKIPAYKRSRRIGRVYQDPSLGTCGQLTILENIALADCKGKAFNLRFGIEKKRLDFYRETLSKLNLGLENKLDVKVGSLSGGQRQSMALLMSTMTNLDFLILDEHTAALDPKTAETVMALTNKIVREKGLTTIMVTHNLRHAKEYGNRMIMMNQGKIILDKNQEAKDKLDIDDILNIFNTISLTTGR